MEFKKLEIEPESNLIKKLFWSKQAKKTIIFTVIGALIGLLYFYLTEGKNMEVIQFNDFAKSLLLGGFIGLFITNSPCARNKC